MSSVHTCTVHCRDTSIKINQITFFRMTLFIAVYALREHTFLISTHEDVRVSSFIYQGYQIHLNGYAWSMVILNYYQYEYGLWQEYILTHTKIHMDEN